MLANKGVIPHDLHLSPSIHKSEDELIRSGLSTAEWSELLPRLNLAKYVTVFANRSTKEI
jgi:hypothetical protein